MVPGVALILNAVAGLGSASEAFRFYHASSVDGLSNDIVQCLMCFHLPEKHDSLFSSRVAEHG